jgi:two-component SAPR family response regulator
MPEGNARILVVDDEWLIAATLEMMLQEIGHEVLGPAPNVGQALMLISETTPDAAILDVALGQDRSFAVADALDAQGVPFVFVTGYATADLPSRFADRPILQKPVARQALQSHLAAILSGRR